MAVSLVSGCFPAVADVLRVDYEGFILWLDCARRGVVRFRYNAQRDQGDLARHTACSLDPHVPKLCQQTSAAPYHHRQRPMIAGIWSRRTI